VNTPQLPSVELIQGSPQPEPTGPARWRRWKVFFSVLLLSSAVGLAIVYGRDPIYRAAASILTVKPKAVDRRSEEADIEHVAIQGRLLLGEELLGRLAQRLAEEGDDKIAGLDQLRSILSVVPVPETNLLELRAEGEYPEQLQRAVNRWAESYEGFRAEEIEAATGRTTAELTDEQAQLQLKIEAARAELLGFREANDIVSLERDENRSLATLKGLNNSLNKAREALVEARARKMAIDEAIANGETVIPSEQKNDMTRMKLDVERTRARVADLKQKYTQRYIDRDPVLKNLPGMLNEMERELVRALELGERTVKDEAQQDVATAEASVKALERELIEHQDKVQKFTERFKEFKAMEEGLAGLEKLLNENKTRLAQIQTQNLKKYPPIQVVEWARVPSRPIYPDYERDLMIALAAALGLALFVTWLVEYLSERSRPSHATPYLGVRITISSTTIRRRRPPHPPRPISRSCRANWPGPSSNH
jgi:succinoglycan biosynthesis transport protein ExoP